MPFAYVVLYSSPTEWIEMAIDPALPAASDQIVKKRSMICDVQSKQLMQ